MIKIDFRIYLCFIMGKIYLLETNLYTKDLEHVYKVGRSDQHGLKRLKDYEKDYEIVIVIACNDSIKVEADVIKLFIQKYKKHLKNEYFVGDKHKMMDDIIEIIRNERIEKEQLLEKERTRLDKEWDWPETELGYYKPKCEIPYRVLKLKKDDKPVMMNREHVRIPSPDLFKD